MKTFTKQQLAALKRCIDKRENGRFPFGVHYSNVNRTYYTNGYILIAIDDITGGTLADIPVKEYTSSTPDLCYLCNRFTGNRTIKTLLKNDEIEQAISNAEGKHVDLNIPEVVFNKRFLKDALLITKPYIISICTNSNSTYPYMLMHGAKASAVILPIIRGTLDEK